MDLVHEIILAALHSLGGRRWLLRIRSLLHSNTDLLASGSDGSARERQRREAGGAQSEQGPMKRRRRGQEKITSASSVTHSPLVGQ